MKVEVDIGAISAKEIEKRDKKIALLERKLEQMEDQVNCMKNTLESISAAKDALMAAAYHIDPCAFQ